MQILILSLALACADRQWLLHPLLQPTLQPPHIEYYAPNVNYEAPYYNNP